MPRAWFDRGFELAQPRCMTTALMTYDDYVALPDDGNRYEVIEGELCLVPAPNLKHQRVLLKLALQLGNFVETHKIGQIYVAPVDVVLSKINVVQPDLLFVSNGRLNILTEAGVSGAPDLAVEVLSPSTHRRDEVTKLRLYENFGVDEYWIVDITRSTVRVYRRSEEKLFLINELFAEKKDSLTTPLLPELAIPLEVIFED